MDEKLITIAVLTMHYGDPNRPVYILKLESFNGHTGSDRIQKLLDLPVIALRIYK